MWRRTPTDRVWVPDAVGGDAAQLVIAAAAAERFRQAALTSLEREVVVRVYGLGRAREPRELAAHELGINARVLTLCEVAGLRAVSQAFGYHRSVIGYVTGSGVLVRACTP